MDRFISLVCEDFDVRGPQGFALLHCPEIVLADTEGFVTLIYWIDCSTSITTHIKPPLLRWICPALWVHSRHCVITHTLHVYWPTAVDAALSHSNESKKSSEQKESEPRDRCAPNDIYSIRGLHSLIRSGSQPMCDTFSCSCRFPPPSPWSFTFHTQPPSLSLVHPATPRPCIQQ